MGDLPKPILFLAFANQPDRPLPRLADELRGLRAALAPAVAAGLCELVDEPYATADGILAAFRQHRDRIALFHFAGHAGSDRLLLEAAGGAGRPADAAGLAAFLAQQHGLALVFLNGCATRGQAQGLLDAGVAAVIATSQAIRDDVAAEFASQFYTSLAAGRAQRAAFDEAAAAVCTTRGTAVRDLFEEEAGPAAVGEPAWALYERPDGAANVWTLAGAAGDPLFGLPPLPRLDLPVTPYRHLEWFRREDAEIFFGRGHEIADLYRRATTPDGDSIILFYGQSGVGKSSVLAAGLLPRLEASHQVRYVRRDQARGLVGTLAAALDAVPGEDLASAWRRGEALPSASALPKDLPSDASRRVEPDLGRRAAPLLVVLDQVEEVFTRPNPDLPDELERFLDALHDLFADPGRRPQGRLILGFRKEWLAEIEKRLEERRLPRAKVFLERLDRAGIVEVVAGPAHSPRLHDRYGLTVAAELPGLIADDLLTDRESPIAPMLQILLTGMWAAATARDYDHPTFDKDLYDELHDKGLGLDDFLARQLQALRGKQPPAVESGLALDLLAHHTTPLGTAEQRAMTELEQTYRHQTAALPGLVQECRDLYLLVDPAKNQPGQGAASRLTHDTLAPHVRKRFDKSEAPGQRARRILENRAVDWEKGKEGTPLDDADLKLVEQGAEGMRARTEAEERLMIASRQARDRRRRNRRILIGTGVLFIVLIAISAGIAFWQRNRAVYQSNRTKASELAALSEGSVEQWPQRSLLLAIEALGFAARADNSYIPAAEQALRDALQRTGGQSLAARQIGANSAAISPDGRWLATGSQDGTTYLWDLRDAASAPTSLASDGRAPIRAVAITPGGEWVVAGDGEGVARLWRIDSPQLPAVRLPAHRGPINALAASNDGRWLVTAGEDGVAYRWDLADPSEPPVPFEGHRRAIYDLAISDDSRWLVTAGEDGKIRKWDLQNPSSPSVYSGHDASVRAVAISPGAKWLVSGSDDPNARVRLWNLSAEGSVPVEGQKLLPPGTGGVGDVAFSADGAWVAAVGGSLDSVGHAWRLDAPDKDPALLLGHSGLIRKVLPAGADRLLTISDDKTARIWSPRSDPSAPTILRGHEEGIVTAAASADGKQLATVDAGGNVRLWPGQVPSPAPIRLPDRAAAVTSVALSRDGQRLATADTDGYVVVRGVASPLTATITLPSPGVAVRAVAFSPDSKWLVTAGDDNLVRRWMLDDLAEPIQVLKGHREPVTYMAVSEDGRWLATASQDNTVRLWDLVNKDVPSRELADHGKDPYALAMSRDGRWVASGDRAGGVLLSDTLNQPSAPQPLQSHNGMVKAIAFSPHGRWLATAGADSVLLYRPGQPAAFVKTLAQARDGFNDVAFSQDNRWLVAAGGDGRLWLWDVSDLGAMPKVLSGHAKSVRDAVFTPDGTRIVSAGDDGKVLLRQMADLSAQPIQLAGHREQEPEINLDAGSRWVLTGDKFGASYLWSLDLPLLKSLACRTAGGNLSEAEQMHFLGAVQAANQLACPGLVSRQVADLELQPAASAVAVAAASKVLVGTPSGTVSASATAPPAALTPTRTPTGGATERAPQTVAGLTSAPQPGLSKDWQGYIDRYLERAREGGKAINDAAALFGVRIVEADVAEGQSYWQVIGVHHLTPEENRGNHSVYLDALDEAGQRLRGAPAWVRYTWEGGGQNEAPSVALDRPLPEPGGSIPMMGRQAVTVWIAGRNPNTDEPSDRVENLHTQHPGESGQLNESWNSIGHHSFYVVFQRTRKATPAAASAATVTATAQLTPTPTPTRPTTSVAVSPPPSPQPEPTIDWGPCLFWDLGQYVQRYVDRARQGGAAINDAANVFDVRITEADVEDGDTYWKAIGVHRLAPGENMPGEHSLGLLLLDERGQGNAGKAWVQRTWTENGQAEKSRTEVECSNRLILFPGIDFSLSVLGADPDLPDKSDRVERLRTDHPREGSSMGLSADATRPQSFFVVFQRTRKIVPPVVKLAITEIMYDPPPEPEFVEVTNLGTVPVELSGAGFVGISFTFGAATVIQPGESLVVVGDAAAFAAAHSRVPVAGVFTGKLANEGERIALRAANGQILASVTYGVSGAWPVSGERRGSLILVDADGDPNDPKSWRLSGEATGSPGKYPD